MILHNVTSILAGECPSGDDSKKDENEGKEYDKQVIISRRAIKGMI